LSGHFGISIDIWVDMHQDSSRKFESGFGTQDQQAG
jgi:hypothetical protein